MTKRTVRRATLAARFRAVAGFDLHELAGATLASDIPIPAAIANRLIARRLASSGGPVSAVRVLPLDDDQFEAHVSIPAVRLLPTIRVHVRIEQQPSPSDPVLRLRWSMPAFGPLTMFAGSVVSHLGRLPQGVRIDGDRVTLDVREIAAAQDVTELLDYITDLQVHTHAGAFWLRLGLKVSPAANTARPMAGTPSASGSPDS